MSLALPRAPAAAAKVLRPTRASSRRPVTVWLRAPAVWSPELAPQALS